VLESHRADSGGGLRRLLGHRTLRPLVATACISTFATAFTMTAEVPLVFELGVGAVGLGALTACWGAGMVGGSWWAGRALHRGNEATGVLVGRLAMAAGVGSVALAPALGPMLASYLLGGIGGGFMGVAAQSMIMRAAPDHLRARTLGTIEACRNVAFGLGVIGAGTAVGLTGARPVYAAVGLTMAVGTLPVAGLVLRPGARAGQADGGGGEPGTDARPSFSGAHGPSAGSARGYRPRACRTHRPSRSTGSAAARSSRCCSSRTPATAAATCASRTATTTTS
jgi:MFS family permease